jgi:two-component system CheB/CheR fusion protein
VAIELVAAPRPVPVLADPTRLGQIVGNLLMNSAKFTASGGHTRVEVTTDGNDALVRVIDDGIGMSPETLETLFQPFAQAEQALERNKGGLGLGLALVKGLVELHGGTVSAVSDGIGKGSTVSVRLPLDTEAPMTAGPAPSARRGKQRSVLIIEDNADAAASLSDVLRFGGHRVEVAHNGPDGIAKAKTLHPDIVLCDIGLPGMDGYDVARAFRADATLTRTFLVALSGYALPEDVKRAIDAGFTHHMPKPPVLEKLTALLSDMSSPPHDAAGPF